MTTVKKLKKVIKNGETYELGGGIESSNNTYENIIHLSEADYKALQDKDPNTMYSTPDDESGGFEPENEGTTGQVLTRTSTGYQYETKQSTITITLTSAGRSSNTQTITATGVNSNNTVIVSPAPASIEDYTDNKVYCSAQGTDSLTFTCDNTPSNDITVNVVILN